MRASRNPAAMTQNSRPQFLALSAIAVLGVLAYSNTFTNEFVWDDVSSILVHETVQDPSRFFQLFAEDQHKYMGGQGNFYRPLVAASFMLDYALSADAATPPGEVPPFLFHVSSTAWHVAAAMLLFALLSQVGAPFLVRTIVALVYVVHPLHTEAVAYISGRADSMAAAFMFAGLACALWNGSARRQTLGWVLSGLCFAGALMSKESAIAFPALLLLIVAALRPSRTEDEEKPGWKPYVPVVSAAGIAAVYIALRLSVLNFGSDTRPPDTTAGQRILETGQALALYVKLMFVPAGLHMERRLYDTPDWAGFAGFVLLAAVLGLALLTYWTRQRRAAIGFAWFLLTWFPISGMIPLNAPMAEHWLYVPMAGFFWGCVELLYAAAPQRIGRPVLAAVSYAFCLYLLTQTLAQNRVWRDNATLYESIIAYRDDSLRANFNLAATYEDLEDNGPGARRHYLKILDIYQKDKQASGEEDRYWDEELEAHLSLGRLYAENQLYNQAVSHYGTLMRVDATESTRGVIGEGAFRAGQIFANFGNYPQAAPLLQRAAQLRPDLAPPVGRLLAEAKIIEAAIQEVPPTQSP